MNIDTITSFLENGQLQEAKAGYEMVLTAGSDEEKFLLAEELFRFGFLEETKELLNTLLQTYPDEGELLILLAETYLEMGDEETAMLTLDKVNGDDSEYPRALLLMADLYQMNGLFEVSEQKLLRAKQLLPEEEIIDFALGELYATQGRFSEAIVAYEKVIKIRQEVAGASLNQRLAEVYSASGEFEEALNYYQEALNDRLEINTLFGYAFTALQAGRNRTAIEKFEELKALDPEYHSLYLHLAQSYEREELLVEAFEAISAGIKQDEFNKDLYYYGGKIALKLAREEEAERLLREAIALDPGFTEGALVLNKLLIKQERYEDVLGLIEDTDLNEEDEPQLIWDSAVALQHLEQYSMALNKYQLAYTFFKENKEFLKDYGYFLIEEGKIAEAAEIFSMLVKLEPGNEEYRELIERLTEDY
ncbi:tetratricopeptide repeat protein [Mesobacillus foraminis]|uniref:Tetratricopeptide repeat protein n=1 Tax=Mesobacillus foraminis TaxID=279826 RepID=A0A4R2B8L0_9BACI|nr:tetratricopeptide repeat protein [Mesobacillus foraminis]TCN23051.1 tetratricopeptide repeat protein [Mesobacillus foraminis]